MPQLLIWVCPWSVLLCVWTTSVLYVKVGKGLQILSVSNLSWTLIYTLKHDVSQTTITVSLSGSILDLLLIFVIFIHVILIQQAFAVWLLLPWKPFFPILIKGCLPLPLVWLLSDPYYMSVLTQFSPSRPWVSTQGKQQLSYSPLSLSVLRSVRKQASGQSLSPGSMFSHLNKK